jgi:hypothetical protein
MMKLDTHAEKQTIDKNIHEEFCDKVNLFTTAHRKNRTNFAKTTKQTPHRKQHTGRPHRLSASEFANGAQP